MKSVYTTHDLLNAGDGTVLDQPEIIALGDSWFWYPFGSNIVSSLAKFLPDNDRSILLIGSNGQEASAWATKFRTSVQFTMRNWAKHSKRLMLSGGGNDVAGEKDFLPLLKKNCSGFTEPQDCFAAGQPGAVVEAIKQNYLFVIEEYRRYNSTGTVICHNYATPFPTGKGVFGNSDWLRVPMEKAKVPKDLQRKVFRLLLLELSAMHLTLAQESLGPIEVIESEDELDDEKYWQNELHPNREGFDRLVKRKWLPIILAGG